MDPPSCDAFFECFLNGESLIANVIYPSRTANVVTKVHGIGQLCWKSEGPRCVGVFTSKLLIIFRILGHILFLLANAYFCENAVICFVVTRVGNFHGCLISGVRRKPTRTRLGWSTKNKCNWCMILVGKCVMLNGHGLAKEMLSSPSNCSPRKFSETLMLSNRIVEIKFEKHLGSS